MTIQRLDQDHSVRREIKDGPIRNQTVDDGTSCQRQGTRLFDFRFAVFVDMFHDDDDAFCSIDEVHRPAHAFDHLARNHPVREVTVLIDFHPAEDREVDVATANHRE